MSLSAPGATAEVEAAAAAVAITVVGDALLDVHWTGSVDRISPDAPIAVLDAAAEQRRPGGAGLAALCAAAAGARVTLITGLGDDAEAASLRAELERGGIDIVDLGLRGPTPTKLWMQAGNQSLLRVDRNCQVAASLGAWTEAASAALEGSACILVSDYGRGMAATPVLSVLVQAGVVADQPTPVVWDPHTRGPRPVQGVDLVTPNLAEATVLLSGGDGISRVSAVEQAVDAAAALAGTLGTAVAVTAGAAGAALAEPGAEPVVVPVEPAVGDVCGAGDAFAATVAVERGRGATRLEAVVEGTRAARRHVLGETRLPAGSLSDGAPPWPSAPGAPGRSGPFLAGSGERRVVAAGGCFDVLHAGHIRLLEAARRLGDELVVCLNGDLSVRRLKGPHRPINRVEDRAAVLRGLGCVDDVVVFEEDTPCEALRRIRPALFVKGNDYAGAPLPEREVLAEWGGQVVLLPVFPGRSTSRILHAAASAAS